jgi:hypothetical protein
MPVDAALMARAMALMPSIPDSDDLRELTSIPEVIAYVAAYARSEGADEVELCEVAARAAELSRAERRSAATVLRRLGYRSVADMLQHLKPLPRN